MKENDKSVIERLCGCGMGYEDLVKSFPDYPADEIKTIYLSIRNDEEIESIMELKLKIS